MRASLDELLTALDELAVFVKSIEPVSKALKTHPDEVVRRYLTTRRRLDYAAFIVVLYAAFEGFVENLAWSYAQRQASHVKYARLPEQLQAKHLKRSGELIAQGRLGEGRYSDVDHVGIVTNLYSCVSGKQPYTLNRHAVVQHQNNLRAAIVTELFAAVGVPGIHDLARKAAPLVQWYRHARDITEPEVRGNVIDLRLDELVERRNQVAHGGAAPEESLDATSMQMWIDFVSAYATALYRVMAGEHLRSRIEQAGAGERLTLRAGPYQQGLVVVVAKPTLRIFTGQIAVGVRAGEPVQWGQVQEIRADDVRVPSVETGAPVGEVGLRLDFKVTQRTTLHLLHDVDEVGWL